MSLMMSAPAAIDWRATSARVVSTEMGIALSQSWEEAADGLDDGDNAIALFL